MRRSAARLSATAPRWALRRSTSLARNLENFVPGTRASGRMPSLAKERTLFSCTPRRLAVSRTFRRSSASSTHEGVADVEFQHSVSFDAPHPGRLLHDLANAMRIVTHRCEDWRSASRSAGRQVIPDRSGRHIEQGADPSQRPATVPQRERFLFLCERHAALPHRDASPVQVRACRAAFDAELGAKLLHRLTGEVAIDQRQSRRLRAASAPAEYPEPDRIGQGVPPA